MSSPDPLATFPAIVRSAHARWLDTHDLAELNTVVLAIVAFHSSKLPALDDLEKLPESTRLFEDLGCDSLAMAEVVFFIEDLYQVALSDEDLGGIHTLAELRTHLHAKVAG